MTDCGLEQATNLPGIKVVYIKEEVLSFLFQILKRLHLLIGFFVCLFPFLMFFSV